MSAIDPYKIMVVVPAFNEQKELPRVVSELARAGYAVVVVDDGSEPPLLSILSGLSGHDLHYLRHPINLGQGAALQTGIEYALEKKADYIVTFDADGQHLVADIEKLIEPLVQNQYDIVLGSRFLEGASHNMSGKRKFLLSTARFVNFIFTGLYLSDAHNGIRAMTAGAAQKLKLKENRMAHATELLEQIRRNHLRWKEMPVTIVYTAYSKQKGQSGWNSFQIFFDLLLNKLYR
jgi:polyprenyl-phospho-N-acetylgalactosaminyl synthase